MERRFILQINKNKTTNVSLKKENYIIIILNMIGIKKDIVRIILCFSFCLFYLRYIKTGEVTII